MAEKENMTDPCIAEKEKRSCYCIATRLLTCGGLKCDSRWTPVPGETISLQGLIKYASESRYAGGTGRGFLADFALEYTQANRLTLSMCLWV